MSLLEVRDLTVRDSLTGALIVRDVHFCLEPGTCLGVVGESGSGKSLTCLALLGLAPPSLRVSGSVRFGGIDLLQAGRETVRGIRGKRIAMIVQQPMTAFDPLYSMGAQLLETLRATTSAFSEKESRGRIVEALEMMHIHNPLDVLKKYPYQLSGGMLQRCMIAVALLQRPDIIIADEPTTALDSMNQREVVAQFHWIRERFGSSLILVSHDLGVVRQLAQEVLVMKDGVVQQVDTPQNLYDFPANEFVAGFIGSPQMNFFDVRLKRENNEVVAYFGDNKIVVPQGKVSKFVDESYVGREVVMGIRPENIHDDEMFLANAADATIDVKVEVTEKMGSETYLYLTTTGKEGNIIARVNPRTTSIAGAEIKVAFDVNHLHFFDKETARTILVSDAVPAPTKTNLTK